MLFAFSLAAMPSDTRAEALTFPLAGVLEVAQSAYLDERRFVQALEPLLPQITLAERFVPPTPDDPFLWALTGTFGGQGTHPLPGAILTCARYGLATREAFAQYGLTAPETFALMGAVLPQFDDTEIWPEDAVARLYCTFVWDDARVVEIMDESTTRAAFGAHFQNLRDQPAPPAVYGAQGYRIDAAEGYADSVVQVESARMTLTLGHQSLSFRSFLMGGGV